MIVLLVILAVFAALSVFLWKRFSKMVGEIEFDSIEEPYQPLARCFFGPLPEELYKNKNNNENKTENKNEKPEI